MTRVIVLRPEPGASETIERAKARGLDAVAIPLFELEPIAWTAPEAGGFDALLLTSANAVRSAGEQLTSLRGLPVHAVGKATAEAGREAGFDISSSGDAGVERLLGSLEADLKLLHLCGEDRKAIADARQRITAVPVYRSRAVEPAPSLEPCLDGVVMIHSPRAAERFADLVSKQALDHGKIALVAISEVAEEAAGAGWNTVQGADQPSDDALLVLAEQLCDKQRQG